MKTATLPMVTNILTLFRMGLGANPCNFYKRTIKPNATLENLVFWSNPYKINVIITFLIEMIGLTNFSQVTTSTI